MAHILPWIETRTHCEFLDHAGHVDAAQPGGVRAEKAIIEQFSSRLNVLIDATI
jgi:hypothetical protein